ncbi:unnamed protein product [Acanthosepion pharaonis]|uniref:Uncharacterized protein n=1 Tax=Acanthosepion pharaonis TaxID=158019 RepID=A0A812CHN6_ACAPH|nr:unnamed protein product [Sepia pharaonis]
MGMSALITKPTLIYICLFVLRHRTQNSIQIIHLHHHYLSVNIYLPIYLKILIFLSIPQLFNLSIHSFDVLYGSSLSPFSFSLSTTLSTSLSPSLPLPSASLPLPSASLPLPSASLPLPSASLHLPSASLPLPSASLHLPSPSLHLSSSGYFAGKYF